MRPCFPSRRCACRARGYTLIESLVASSVLLVGISAAAAMSLTLLTQEEINENTVRAANYLDNAARLVHLGVPPNAVASLLPDEPVVASLGFTQRNVNVAEVGSIPAVAVTITYRPTAAVSANRANILEWTGGAEGAVRSASVEVFTSGGYQDDVPPRIDHFH